MHSAPCARRTGVRPSKRRTGWPGPAQYASTQRAYALWSSKPASMRFSPSAPPWMGLGTPQSG
jgi:hypothetical protein